MVLFSQAGEYSVNMQVCAKCSFGRYAPQALTDNCLVCSSGSHTDNTTGSNDSCFQIPCLLAIFTNA